MGDSLLVTLADIQMIRTENGVVKPLKPVFHRRHVDDKYSRKKNLTDQLYHEVNNNHPNINLNTEIDPKRFLDAKANTKSGKIEIAVYIKRTKLPVSNYGIKQTQFTQTYIVLNGFLQTLIRKFISQRNF